MFSKSQLLKKEFLANELFQPLNMILVNFCMQFMQYASYIHQHVYSLNR